MGQRAYQMDTTTPPAEAAPSSRRRSLPPLLAMGLPVIVLGGLAMLHVVALARLSELGYENQRWEQLCQEQSAQHDELLQQRTQLVSPHVLAGYVQANHLVPAPEPQPLRLGVLPQYQVYWRLPDETTGATGSATASRGTNGLLVGWQAPPLSGQGGQGL